MSRSIGPPRPGPSTADSPEACDRRHHRRMTIAGIGGLLLTAALAAATTLALTEGQPGSHQAVAFAAAVCLPGSLAAWVLSRTPNAVPARALAASLAAIALRLLPPLAALAWLSSGPRNSSPPDRGVVLTVFYLALLATDILLHMMVSRQPRRPATPPD